MTDIQELLRRELAREAVHAPRWNPHEATERRAAPRRTRRSRYGRPLLAAGAVAAILGLGASAAQWFSRESADTAAPGGTTDVNNTPPVLLVADMTGDPVPAAILRGKLESKEGCLVFDGSIAVFAAPAEWQRNDDVIAFGDRGERIPLGVNVDLGGGYIPSIDTFMPLMTPETRNVASVCADRLGTTQVALIAGVVE